MANPGTVNFIALLNGLAEELNFQLPTYHPDRPPAIGLVAAICRFGNTSTSGSGDSVYTARNAAACLMWSNLGNGVRVDTRCKSDVYKFEFLSVLRISPFPFSLNLIMRKTDGTYFFFLVIILFPFFSGPEWFTPMCVFEYL